MPGENITLNYIDKYSIMIYMAKNFTDWLTLKQAIDNSARTGAGYKEREIWWMSIGHNVGFEEDGKGTVFSRPVLIVKGFSAQIFWGIPLSSISKSGVYYYAFTIVGQSNPSTAILSQLRVFDTKRLTTKLGVVNKSDFEAIKNQLRMFLS